MKIVVLTGAGISRESGIDTFRDKDGLWEQYPAEQVATPQGFAADPERVHHFYNLRRKALKTVKPNPAHKALAELEESLAERSGKLTIITQNVDDLHERGGAKNVIHMHGTLLSFKCDDCRCTWRFEDESTVGTKCPSCRKAGHTRPDIVWFGEMPYHMEAIEIAIMNCDLFASIGTSGSVYPAAGFVEMARRLGKQTLELNLDPSDGAHLFHETRLGKAGTLVPEWVREIISKTDI